MTYADAIALAAKGSPVRRAAWPDKETLVRYDGKIMKRSALGAMQWYVASNQDAQATDWEINSDYPIRR